MGIRFTQKERLLHSMNTSFFRTFEGRARQKVLRTPADLVSWGEDLPALLRSLVRVVQISLEKTMKSLKSSALADYSMHVVLLNSSEE